VAYVGVPAFIVTLGGYLAWRGMIFRTGGKQGQTLAPLDKTFRYLGAPRTLPTEDVMVAGSCAGIVQIGGGAVGSTSSWCGRLHRVAVVAVAVVGLVAPERITTTETRRLAYPDHPHRVML
jgi:ABC-type xylose transport system permease subunit